MCAVEMFSGNKFKFCVVLCVVCEFTLGTTHLQLDIAFLTYVFWQEKRKIKEIFPCS